jgi:hypothetical protein
MIDGFTEDNSLIKLFSIHKSVIDKSFNQNKVVRYVYEKLNINFVIVCTVSCSMRNELDIHILDIPYSLILCALYYAFKFTA